MNLNRRVFTLVATFMLAGASQLLALHITTFSPKYGSPGDLVTISGSGFYPGTLVVQFGGVTDRTAQAIAADGTQIQATVPSGAATGPIRVTVNGVSADSLEIFTVIGPGPYITGFSPAFGSDGSQVYINGAHFTTATSAYFNGKAGTGFYVESDIRIQVKAPAGLISGPIKVSSPQGSYTTSSNFLAPPVVSGFATTTGRAGTNVLIKGTNFLESVAVWFNDISADFNVLSNNAIVATVPLQATTGRIRVGGLAGSFTTTTNFVVQPLIAGFSPKSGSAGTVVTLTGANFKTGATVKFNGTAASSVSGVSFNQLTVVVPNGATTGPLSITTPDGSHTSVDLFFVPPTITSFSPTNSAPGSRVMISGVNLANATELLFNDLPAPSFMVTNNTTMSAIVPLGVTTGPLSVTTPGGKANSGNLLFYAVPVITAFFPTHGLPGTNVTLYGSSFLGTTAVLFNGTPASILSAANNQLVVAVPIGAQTGPITVTAPAGSVTTPDSFVLDYTSDLAITATDSPDPVTLGSNLVYTISLKNNGPFDAPNVLLTNTLPDSASLQSVSVTQGTLTTNGTTLLASFGNLAKDLSASLTFNVRPQSVGLITNSAGATSGYVDPKLSNNGTNIVTMVEPLPLLSISQPSNSLIKVSWLVALTNWVLEYNATLSTNFTKSNLFWSNVTTAPVISGAQKSITETNSEAAKVYRLRK